MSRVIVSREGGDRLGVVDKFTVHTHIILRNWWEYYLEKPDEDGRVFGYVMGAENEWGYAYMPELRPHIISETTDMDQVMPPEGYKWKDASDD